MTRTYLQCLAIGCLIAFSGSRPVPIAAAQEKQLSIDLGNQVSMEWVLVPHGSFVQGSPEGESGREPDESQHPVTLTQDFYMAKFPVTVGQFRQFVAETKYHTEAETGKSGAFGFNGKDLQQRTEFHWKNPGYPMTDRHPVTTITLKDANAFAAWLSTKSGRKCTLPSEAQFEFACRAGTSTRFYLGDDDSSIDRIGWSKNNSSDGAKEVGQKEPNALGLFDMSGNVYQWCSDVYNAYQSGPNTDPLQKQAAPNEKVRYVLRGGSWLKDPRRMRSAARFRSDPGSRNADIGFRLIAAVDAPRPADTAIANPTPPTVDTTPHSTTEPISQDSTPPAPFNPAPPTPVSSSSSSFNTWIGILVMLVIGLLCIIAPVGIFTYLVVSAITNNRPQPNSDSGFRQGMMRSTSGSDTRRPDASVDLTNDGFWFSNPGHPIGSLVSYRYWSGIQAVTDQFLIENAARQFVYTGPAPSQVSIDRIDPPEPDRRIQPIPYPTTQDDWNNPSYSTPHTWTNNTPRHSSNSSTSTGSSHFPSAYG